MNSKKDVVAQLQKFLTSAPDGSGQLYAWPLHTWYKGESSLPSEQVPDWSPKQV